MKIKIRKPSHINIDCLLLASWDNFSCMFFSFVFFECLEEKSIIIHFKVIRMHTHIGPVTIARFSHVFQTCHLLLSGTRLVLFSKNSHRIFGARKHILNNCDDCYTATTDDHNSFDGCTIWWMLLALNLSLFYIFKRTKKKWTIICI